MNEKILLVTFQNNTEANGLKYIRSYLCQHQIDPHILFIPDYDEKHISAIETFLKRFKPIIIGISLMSAEFDNAKSFSEIIKIKFPEIVIAWGGIHPTVSPEECLEYADYVFIGESEHAFLEFVNAISNSKPANNILNLAYKSSAGITINKLRPLNNNLDDLPFPEHLPEKSSILHNGQIMKLSRSLFNRYSRYSGRSYDLTTTRGCPFSCAYCCNSAFSKLYGASKIRQRSVDNVIKEMQQAVKLFPELIYINIQDDNFFSYDIGWMTVFAEACETDIKNRFVCRTTPAHLTEDKISMLKKAGLAWIFMGLQSGSPRINKEVYKRFVPNEKFIEAAKLVKKCHVAGFYDIILDNPYETEEDLLETINVILKIPKPFMLQLFSLCFYQGTELHDRALKEKLAIENPRQKNYAKYQPTFLNKVVRLCPLLSNKLIVSLVKNRKSRWTNILLNSIYSPSILFLEPFIWMKLVLISFDYNIPTTIKMILSFSKTGISQIFLRKR
jgi:anaerobic magnesium-protoporphyrin IX monomethyl ester cyclase